MSSGSYDEIWCHTCEQIEEYLLDCGAERSGDTFLTAGCRITLQTLPDRCIGSLVLPRTRVRMEGPCSKSFHHAFFLHFLSGGG